MSNGKYYTKTINDGSRVSVEAYENKSNRLLYAISTTDISDASIQKLEEDVDRNATAITEAGTASSPQFLAE